MEHGGLEETRAQVIARRAKTVPPILLGLLAVTALFPLALVAALAVDLVRWIVFRRPWMAVRLLCFLWAYLAAESGGLIALLGIWLASGCGARRAWLAERTWRFQQVWAGALFAVARTLFGLRVEVSDDDAVRPGPVLVLIRHASIVDNLLPSVFVARAHRLHLRYVLKRDLLSDPCLDVAGRRLPNYFVRRGTGEEVERRNIRRLAEGLGPQDGVVLYPEGTRFTPERRRLAIARLEASDPALAARAERIRHLLAPRVGGFLAVLDGAPEADVVVLAHQGLDGLRLISDIWGGAIVGRTIRVRFTRTARSAIPEDRADRVRWLFDAWADADAWVGAQIAGASAPVPVSS